MESKSLSVCLVAMFVCFSKLASANPGDILIQFMAAERYPIIEDGTGVVHAFACIDLDLNSGIKEDCYGFYPRGGQSQKITLSNGDALLRSSGSSWRESTTGINFVQQSEDCNDVQLFDPNRNFYWKLPIPTGKSYWRVGSGSWNGYYSVTKIDRALSPLGFVGGAGMVCPEFVKNPSRFANVKESYSVNITESQRQTIIGVFNSWNTASYSLTQNSCIDLVDQVAAALNLKRPRRSATQLPTDYLKQLKEEN
ncbi:hypothetical protein [Burkholderia paludis]|uniref:hypothetical protein n=1 Tax=Burkholderia paludis TaxID=1506587 RepID=UPI0012698959|nr:hypothetical protein [Burkholderia paludis]